jgi:hypothetical protein
MLNLRLKMFYRIGAVEAFVMIAKGSENDDMKTQIGFK